MARAGGLLESRIFAYNLENVTCKAAAQHHPAERERKDRISPAKRQTAGFERQALQTENVP